MIGYRTLASSETTDAREKILGAIEYWLRYNKGFDEPSIADQTSENDRGHTLRHQRRTLEDGFEAWRWSFTEEWPKLPWQDDDVDVTSRMQITFTTDGKTVWLLTDIHPPVEKDRYGERPRHSGTPGFITKLLDNVELYDGQTPLSRVPFLADSAETLDNLLNAIRDESRRGLVVVSSPYYGQTPAQWQNTLKDILHGTQGLASVHMVAPEKLDAFNEWAGMAHSLAPGSIRTYKPGADFENPLDGYLHRTMPHHRIVGKESSKKLNRILCRSLVSELSTAELPATLRQADSEFRKPVRPHQAPSARGNLVAPSALQEEIEELNELLDVSDRENVSLRARIDQADKNLRDLSADNDLLTLEVSTQHDKLDQLRADKRILERRLHELSEDNRYFNVSAPPQEYPASPDTFEELIERIEELPGVLWCGDPRTTAELDEYTDLGASVVLKTWEVLLTFNAYAEARAEDSYDKNVIQYQRNHDAHGKYMRISKLSAQESSTVQQNQKMRDQRTFDVPKEIHSSGKLTMYAHVPLATGRGRSPRLYFEDTWTINGRVTVGYIGPHLDNKSTN